MTHGNVSLLDHEARFASIENQLDYLLTDEQMGAFITKGYVVLRNELPVEVHESLLNKIAKVMVEEGNPGNNILPRIPEIQSLFETPVVKGALTSILGSNYYMHPHRHCHYNPPGKLVPQEWHKDGYWSARRSHRPWWAIIFYYTQDVTEEMGPTGILPGSQYYEKYPEVHPELQMPSGKAGTMVLVHFDLWHRASLNQSNIDRYMLKFQFVRLHAPTYPSWNHRNPNLVVPQDIHIVQSHQVIWNDIWRWLLGQSESGRCFLEQDRPESVNALMSDLNNADPTIRSKAIDTLGVWGVSTNDIVYRVEQLLDDPSEAVSLNAAYALGQMGERGIHALHGALTEGDDAKARSATYGLSSAGAPAVTVLIETLRCQEEAKRGYAVFALGMIGSTAKRAVPPLLELLFQDSSPLVKRNVVEALGMIRQPSGDIIRALIRALEDGEAEKTDGEYVESQTYIIHKIRYAATLSLLRIGSEPATRDAVLALRKALSDDDRYVRAYAFEALTYIKSDAAIETLIDFARKSRWCPDTTPRSTF